MSEEREVRELKAPFQSMFFQQMAAEGSGVIGQLRGLLDRGEAISTEEIKQLILDHEERVAEAKKADSFREFQRGRETGYTQALREQRARFEPGPEDQVEVDEEPTP